jgi:predicted secreted hydrolase
MAHSYYQLYSLSVVISYLSNKYGMPLKCYSLLLPCLLVLVSSCMYNKHFNTDKKVGNVADTLVDLKVHKRNSLEWWYFSSHVKDSLQNDYGVMFTVFKRYMPIFGERIMLNMTITDEKNKTFYKWYDFQKLKKKRSEKNGFSLKGSKKRAAWQLNIDSLHQFTYNVKLKKHPITSLTITQQPLKPIVHEAKDGYMNYGSLGKAGYLSYTNMKTTGSFTINNITKSIEGDGWFDKQWNCITITQPKSSWVWLGIQLNNKEEIMIFKTQHKKTNETIVQATYIDSIGNTTYIHGDDIVLTPVQYYLSPTFSIYPVVWNFEIKSLQIRGQIKPLFNDHEINLKPLGISFMKYWEGKCYAQITKNNKVINGNAFLEMTRP